MDINIKDINRADSLKARHPDHQYDKGQRPLQKPVLRGESLRVSDLSAGDRFLATVRDKTPENMTIKLPGGEVITAKTVNNPDVRIGESVIFQVMENFKGQILLEMVIPGKSGGGATLSEGVVTDALAAAEMPITKENIALVRNLVAAGMPISADVLHKAAFFMYYDSELNLSFQQIKFLLDENFPMEPKTVETFKAHLEGAAGLGKQASELLELLEKLGGAERRDILEILAKFGGKGFGSANEAKALSQAANHAEYTANTAAAGRENAIKQAIASQTEFAPEIQKHTQAGLTKAPNAAFMKNAAENAASALAETSAESEGRANAGSFKSLLNGTFFVDIAKTGLKELNSFYKELDLTAARLMEYIATRQDAGEPLKELQKPLADIRANLEFLSQVSDTKEFLQIPFVYGQDINEAELHIFKNKRKKAAPGTNSALIALNYANLGHVQVRVTRTDDRIRLGFFAETNKVLNILASETYKLTAELSAKGLSAAGYSFKKINEDFSVHSIPDNYIDNTGQITKYSVDVRV